MVELERLRDNLTYNRPRRGLTYAKLAECQYVMKQLATSRSGSQLLVGMCACSVRTCKPWLCATPAPLTCSRRTPSLGAVSALQASMGSVSTLSSCTSAT